ncbi:MAG: preprotein translocase subunit SecY [Sulfuricurvum sp.]|uniref:preprotein translocase subunit SecY n=1 Tax=Sulfuricurvum sp. TaxID=2025608 RepID=UPI00261DA430|nr:preprotein translocase subunit SecY [Sulfuricurvum sp.]MDD2828166.1 preprotein translocase subunit SecY [Sulfuricurvum sp.]MDD4949879.1 preprotein translocase subunit SecY [Sulfuricurvum sp.]
MNQQLVNKILITIGFLFIYRLLAYVPVPGVDTAVIASFFNSHQADALGLFNMFSGKAVERFSIISLGIMPYITASIIMELLAATFPTLAQMKKERDGMVKYMQIIRYATIAITIVQAIGVSVGLQHMGGKDGTSAILVDHQTFVILAVVSMLAGTMLLMWIGEQITQSGIGNGVSLIIFAGIVSAIPSAIGHMITMVNTGAMSFLVVLAIFALVVATVLVIIYVELGERRIPVTYAKKTMLQNQNKRVMNYIPVKVNLSGVIPVIFASAILMFPMTVLSSSTNPTIQAIADVLNPNHYFFNFLQFMFIAFFAFFYASIVFNAKDISDNLKRQGGFIPGIRPGESTKEFLNDTAGRLTITGAIYLGLIATLPWVVVKAMGVPFFFGGTAVLIVVQVALDTMRRVEAQVYTSKYQTLSAVGL